MIFGILVLYVPLRSLGVLTNQVYTLISAETSKLLGSLCTVKTTTADIRLPFFGLPGSGRKPPLALASGTSGCEAKQTTATDAAIWGILGPFVV